MLYNICVIFWGSDKMEKNAKTNKKVNQPTARNKNSINRTNHTDEKFHTGIVVVASVFVLLVSFFAYMINTDLQDVLEKEYNGTVVTHENTKS